MVNNIDNPLVATDIHWEDNESNTLKPVFDFRSMEDIGINDVKDEVAKFLITNLLPQHKDVLDLLLNQLQPVDFVVMVFPEAKPLTDELKAIKDAYNSGNTTLSGRLDKPTGTETSRTLELEIVLKAMEKKIKPKNYVVCIMDELLRIAKLNNWNLCKCYDYVYAYNGGYWKQLEKDSLKNFLGNAAIRFGFSELEAKYHLFKNELLNQFLAQAQLTAPEKDADNILINLQNGTFEFIGNVWNLRPFDTNDFLTYQLPFDYDSSATSPLFDKYLEKVLPDLDSRLILQEFAGFIFSNVNAEKCLVLTGGGKNGKSVFFNILTALLGRENTLTYPLGLFNQEYNRAKLTNVLLNYSSEKGVEINPDTFKALVSGEPLQAREPYGKSFTIHNKVRFILNCNELPKETESTDAFFRRFLIIPFDVKISEAETDLNLANKIIKSELPGVFNWLLSGLTRLNQQQKFTESIKVNKAIAEFRRQSDSVALFVDEHGYKKCTENKILVKTLYSDYKSFCYDGSFKVASINTFSIRLHNSGFEKTRSTGGSSGFFIRSTNQN